AADALDDLPQADAHGNFDEPGVGNFSRESKDLGSLAALRTYAGKPFAAFADDRRDVGEGLYIINQRRLAPQAARGRVGRPRLGCAALAFNGGDQRSFLAADKR